MAAINTFLKKGYVSKSGQLPIIIEYTHLGSRFRYNTKIKIDPRCLELYFDDDHDLFKVRSMKSGKDNNKKLVRSINDKLAALQSKLNSVVFEQKQKSEPLTTGLIKAKFESSLKYSQVVNAPINLIEWFDRFIQSKKSGLSKGLNSYRSTRNHLAAHLGTSVVFLTDLKRPFFDGFLTYLNSRALRGSTIYKQFKNIRTMLNWVKLHDEEDEIKIPSTYKSYRTVAKYAEPLGLTINEFRQLRTVDLSERPELDRTRDLFVFGVAVGGVRHGDLVGLGKMLRHSTSDVNSITFFEQKTSNEHRDVPINTLAKSILMKYTEFPHVPSNQRMNKNLKEIAKLLNWSHKTPVPTFNASGRIEKTEFVPLQNLISTKFMRKTAATIDGELNIEPVVSMLRSGHKSLPSYMRYRRTTKTNFEIANQKWDALVL